MSKAGSSRARAEEDTKNKSLQRDSIESSMQEDTRYETADGSRNITFASTTSPPMTSQMQRLPGIANSLNTPNSLMIQSTISDEGISGMLEQGPERFMVNRTGFPLKTSHEQKRRRDEVQNLYARRMPHGSNPFAQRHANTNLKLTPLGITPLEGLSVDSQFYGEKNAHLMSVMKKGVK